MPGINTKKQRDGRWCIKNHNLTTFLTVPMSASTGRMFLLVFTFWSSHGALMTSLHSCIQYHDAAESVNV